MGSVVVVDPAALPEELVAEALLDVGAIRDAVVERHPLEAVEALGLHELVEVQLEGRLRGGERADLPLLADGGQGHGLAVDLGVGHVPVERTRPGAVEAVLSGTPWGDYLPSGGANQTNAPPPQPIIP